jgi:hypothetical protein
MAVNPKGIRFDPVKLKFVMEREGLTSAQKVVNWFLDAYYWKNKETPFLPQPASPMTQNIILPIQATPTRIHPVDAYKNDLNAATSIRQIETIDKEIQADPELSGKQKETLKAIAKEISKTLDV